MIYNIYNDDFPCSYPNNTHIPVYPHAASNNSNAFSICPHNLSSVNQFLHCFAFDPLLLSLSGSLSPTYESDHFVSIPLSV